MKKIICTAIMVLSLSAGSMTAYAEINTAYTCPANMCPGDESCYEYHQNCENYENCEICQSHNSRINYENRRGCNGRANHHRSGHGRGHC